MHFTPGEVYHVYNCGNNKQSLFFNDDNYLFFLKKITIQLKPVSDILSWCSMPNHFHLMISATQQSCNTRASLGGKSIQNLSYRIGILLSSYSKAINKQNGGTGSLFQQKTKAKCFAESNKLNINTHKESYLSNCMNYIHQNPWKPGWRVALRIGLIRLFRL